MTDLPRKVNHHCFIISYKTGERLKCFWTDGTLWDSGKQEVRDHTDSQCSDVSRNMLHVIIKIDPHNRYFLRINMALESILHLSEEPIIMQEIPFI